VLSGGVMMRLVGRVGGRGRWARVVVLGAGLVAAVPSGAAALSRGGGGRSAEDAYRAYGHRCENGVASRSAATAAASAASYRLTTMRFPAP
jgi:hypothetical protein